MAAKKKTAKKKKVVRKKVNKKTTKKKIVKKKATESTVKKVSLGIVYANGTGKPSNGRPPTVIDLDQVFSLATIGCTQVEIYSVLKINKETWRTAKKHNPIIQETLNAGVNEGNASLRKKQIQVAMQGNPQMLVWLGKNKLNQSDKSIQHIELSQGETFKQALLGNDSDEDNEDFEDNDFGDL